MKCLDIKEPYSQRTTEITILGTAAERGMQAVILQAPCIFGEGTGLFNQQSFGHPLILWYAVQHGHGFKLNNKANFDWAHVVDLADYFVLLILPSIEKSGLCHYRKSSQKTLPKASSV
ncbi:hypothetical protein BU25DRAFT_195177 [Macroventuria anomochaeta]|uniref:Uncharacterized protein n=1 Tax=Macroventuria anomochaeta TaxID=301207 RepID=A0ACB6SCI3_9PLEO|nr:uncharacterized protein BU25DRAFT_195177 [Macroventuria anomochaeta]KAF2631697.1 hypothetical protein BU25DRAFT_195177 [Macroventuria anomochaeta]